MQNDDELVEKVARAIYTARNGRGCAPWTRIEGVHKEPYRLDARAAIAVMREAGWKGPDEIKTAEGLAALAAVDGLDL